MKKVLVWLGIFFSMFSSISSAFIYKETMYHECDKHGIKRSVDIADMLANVMRSDTSHIIVNRFIKRENGSYVIRILTTTACVSVLLDKDTLAAHVHYFSIDHDCAWAVLECFLEDILKPRATEVLHQEHLSSVYLHSALY